MQDRFGSNDYKVVFRPIRIDWPRFPLYYVLMSLFALLFAHDIYLFNLWDFITVLAVTGFVYLSHLIKLRVLFLRELAVDIDSVHLRYPLRSQNKSFSRFDVRLKERRAGWLQQRGIKVYVNGNEVETIDPRFDIDAIMAHPELDVERV